MGVQGKEGDLGVLWDYYLVASPEGDQLLATFTLAQNDAEAFGDQDLELIGSLEWRSRHPPRSVEFSGVRSIASPSLFPAGRSRRGFSKKRLVRESFCTGCSLQYG